MAKSPGPFPSSTTHKIYDDKERKKKRIKLLHFLQVNGFATSNKNAKKLIRDQRVLVNGLNAISCSMMVSGSLMDGQVEVLSHQNEILEPISDDIESQETIKPLSSDKGNTCNTSTSSTTTTKLNCATRDNKTITTFCIAYHKPCGMICTTSKNLLKEQENCETLSDVTIPHHFHPVGRLDRHSHGLFLFSTDGRLSSALLSPKTCLPRVYEIIVRGDVGIDNSQRYEDIMRQVETGVNTDYGFFEGNILRLERDVGKRGYAHETCDGQCGAKRNDKFGLAPEEFKKEQAPQCLKDVDKNTEILSLIQVQVKEGKKRMVRRLFAALDLYVLGRFISVFIKEWTRYCSGLKTSLIYFSRFETDQVW